MDKVTDIGRVGYFLPRKNLPKVALVDLIRELHNNLFEAFIMREAIVSYQRNEISLFDCLVGDWKCQTRMSMIVDISKNKFSFDDATLCKVNFLISHIQSLLESLHALSSVERQALTRDLSAHSLTDILNNYKVDYAPSQELKLLSLCFLATAQNPKLHESIVSLVSTNKLKEFINSAKTTLCLLSIDYEQTLAKKYGSSEEQRVLQQVEFKGIQYMTCLFASFKVIYQKMLQEKHPFLVQLKIFCKCGGIRSIKSQLFRPQKNRFLKMSLSCDETEVISVIEAYQFLGSIEQLQTILGVPEYETYIPERYYTVCTCTKPSLPKLIYSFDDALLAFFAQHPQFTNNSNIAFDSSAQSTSALEKEYNYFLRLPGFSRPDMSQFYIRHMYADTVKNALRKEELLKSQLKAASSDYSQLACKASVL